MFLIVLSVVNMAAPIAASASVDRGYESRSQNQSKGAMCPLPLKSRVWAL